MAEQLSAYQKRVQKERKMNKFFTKTCNSGGLNELLKRYGLELKPDGGIRDRGIVTTLFKNYLIEIVIPAIEKELGIKGVLPHRNPTHLTQNVLQWYKAEIVTNKGEPDE